MRHDPELPVKIQAENNVNKAILEHGPALIEAAKSLVGHLIFKVDGSLRKDIESVLPIPRFEGHDLQISLNRSSSSLSFTFYANTWIANPGHSDHSARCSKTLYLGWVTDKVLERVEEFDPEEYPTDYTVEGIMKAREACEEAKKAYENARSACGPFGEGR